MSPPAARPMRVHHIITRLIVGGAQENTLASVMGLRAKPGVEVQLISGPTSGPEGSLQPLAESVPGLLTLVPSLVRPIRPHQDVLALLQLWRLFRSARPDIVHTHSGKAGILGRLAARAARVPIIIHSIHGPSFGPFQGALANATLQTAERLAGHCTTHFVVVAHAMARQYRAAGIGDANRFTRIVSGFDLEPFRQAGQDPSVRTRLGLGPSHLVVGKIARLFELKGHEDLIAAAPDVIRDLPHLRFLLVGDGPARNRLEEEIARRGLSGHFVFAGLVPPSQIPELIGAMDILVHLSRREGLARALPQALAAGRPVIAYDCDGANEVCLNGRTGYLVPPGNLTAFRERLRFLAADPRLRAELGRQGRALAEEWFPVSRLVDDQFALYQRLLETRSTGQPASPFAARP